MEAKKVVNLILPPDPVKEWTDGVMSKVGDCSWMKRFRETNVLVAKYIRQTVGTSGKLVAPHLTQREDTYQGKVGLVIRLGSQAFVDGEVEFHGLRLDIGDWGVYRASDGWDFNYVPPGTNTMVECRVLRDTDFFGAVSNPNVIY